MEKNIPLIQVTNALRFDSFAKNHKLSVAEIALILILSSHHGEQGIFPSSDLLAQIMNVTKRYIIKLLDSLENKNVIKIVRSQGKSNHYVIHYSSPPQEKLSTTGEPEFTSEQEFQPPTSEPQFTTPVNYSSQSGEPEFTRYNIINNKSNKREREQPSASLQAPPPPFFSVSQKQEFYPDADNQILCRTHGLNLNYLIDSFKARCKREKNQYEFKRWIESELKYRDKINTRGKNDSGEIRCTVPDWVPPQVKSGSSMPWGPGHPGWDLVNKFKTRNPCVTTTPPFMNPCST